MTGLSNVQRGRASRPPRIVMYGIEGIGKSSTAATAPNPIFISTEDGLDEIECHRFPLATKYEGVLTALQELRREPHDYETVVIDSLDWLERLIFDKLCAQFGVSSIEKVDGGYGKGYTYAISIWREVIQHLNFLRNERGMLVLLLAHAKVERFEDPEATAYDRYTPRLNKHAAALLCEWSDAVLFATRKLRTQTEDVGFSRKRTIAHAVGKDGGERILRCIGGPACVAKNRFGLPEELPLSWAALMQAFSENQTEGVSAHG